MGIQNSLIFLYALSDFGMLISLSSTVGAQNTMNSNEVNEPKLLQFKMLIQVQFLKSIPRLIYSILMIYLIK